MDRNTSSPDIASAADPCKWNIRLSAVRKNASIAETKNSEKGRTDADNSWAVKQGELSSGKAISG